MGNNIDSAIQEHLDNEHRSLMEAVKNSTLVKRYEEFLDFATSWKGLIARTIVVSISPSVALLGLQQWLTYKSSFIPLAAAVEMKPLKKSTETLYMFVPQICAVGNMDKV
uniref:DUF2470 domain-containing protein n=1 Tax=Panagrellus redivivus TaxID=6233 RepID=A0A7E4WE13_PANRE